MTPQSFTDEFGQLHCWSYWRNHYVIGISAIPAEARARWAEALKVAQS
jgi:hypothetical protein